MENFYSITNVNSEALSFEREIALLRAWKKYHRRAARETLVKNYLLFTIKTVKRFYSSMPEDDVILLAHRTLLTSIDKFDAEREKVGRLCNLIPLYVKVEYRKFNRESELVKCPAKAPKEGRYISLDATISNGESNGDDLENYEAGMTDVRPVPEVDLETLLGFQDPEIDRDEQIERKKAMREAVESLEPRQKAVIMLVYFEGLDYAAAARKMKPECSREWVRQLHDKAIVVLRDAMKKTEHI